MSPLDDGLLPFEANTLPLDPGVRLLEASAGTGKTFALAHLVLRLVAEAELSLHQLLVVTFTEAAAAELRDRIGQRLQQGLVGLEDLAGLASAGRPAPDLVLKQWLERQPPGQHTELRGRLLLALEELDGADITTIHGFCRRTLRRQALEAGQTPELRLDTDADALVEQIVHDYWQQQVLPLPAHLLEGLRRAGMRPPLLRSLLLDLENDPALRLDPLPEELPSLESLAARLPDLWAERWRCFRSEWQARGRALEADFQAAAAHWRSLGAKKTGDYSPKPTSDRCGKVDAWLCSQPDGGSYPAVLADKLLTGYFHPGTFCREARSVEEEDRAVTLPQAPLLEAVAALVDGPADLALLHACHWGRDELRRRRQRSGSLGFAQLLEGLDPGPACDVPTPLLRAVGERYRVALIDEFQDTDPLQWRILRLAFGGGGHLLVMVGDPKQAIYRFRGGDLATYLEARGRAEQIYRLVENRRSTPALIGALNRLMGPAGLRRSRLPVPEVLPRAERSGPEGAPLQLLWLGGERQAGTRAPTRSDLERPLAGRIAAHAAGLLAGGLTLVHDQRSRPLAADDLCVLVGNHRQAEQLRLALERRGIPSRLVSRADVFQSPAATALQRLLDALADPADPNRLRLLAASPLMGWSAALIARSTTDAWSELAGQLERGARLLERRGLLGVLAELLGSGSLARLSLSGRLQADLQQVAELTQERLHGDQLGAGAAADWLRRLRLDPDRSVPDGHQAHSDRADGAVSVVTVHRSKGLEWPVVICPYLWQAPSRGGVQGFRAKRWQPPGRPDPHLDLHRNRHWGQGREAGRQNRAAEEEEAERLAYVAVTRAQHRLVLAWGPARDQQGQPLLPWLFPTDPLADADPMGDLADGEWLQRLREESAERGLPLEVLDPATEEPPARPATPARWTGTLSCGPVPERRLETGWGRSSYSSWTRGAHGSLSGAALSGAALDEGRDTLDPEPEEAIVAGGFAAGVFPPAGLDEGSTASPDAEPWPERGPLADFPRGPSAGDCLHRILEQIDYGTPSGDDANRAVVERELGRSGLGGQPIEPLLEGLDRLRRTPFGGPLEGFRLEELDGSHRLNEMNFDLTLGFARAGAMAAAFADHPGGAFGGSAYAEQLARLPIASRGFLTGSIDLVFTATGSDGERRWWVADWKSNWLGRRDEEGRPLACGPRHYGPAAMTALMVACHYPLQAHLYLVALHRYLRWRLPDYEPERHLGGYAYVFLRGLPGAEAVRCLPGTVPGVLVERPPLARLLALDAALGRQPAEAR